VGDELTDPALPEQLAHSASVGRIIYSIEYPVSTKYSDNPASWPSYVTRCLDSQQKIVCAYYAPRVLTGAIDCCREALVGVSPGYRCIRTLEFQSPSADLSRPQPDSGGESPSSPRDSAAAVPSDSDAAYTCDTSERVSLITSRSSETHGGGCDDPLRTAAAVSVSPSNR
jgi:hypothetical protein